MDKNTFFTEHPVANDKRLKILGKTILILLKHPVANDKIRFVNVTNAVTTGLRICINTKDSPSFLGHVAVGLFAKADKEDNDLYGRSIMG